MTYACAHCGKFFELNQNGQLKSHWFFSKDGTIRCPGSNSVIVDAEPYRRDETHLQRKWRMLKGMEVRKRKKRKKSKRSVGRDG